MHGLARRALGGAALVAAIALAAGCSSKPQMAQISGTVTFKGKPVPAGYISFTPEPGKGPVRVCQIRDGVFDSAQEPEPGVFPGRNEIRIAGFDGVKVRLWGQGKQIFNPVDDAIDVPSGTSKRDFEIPASAANNLQVVPTADE